MSLAPRPSPAGGLDGLRGGPRSRADVLRRGGRDLDALEREMAEGQVDRAYAVGLNPDYRDREKELQEVALNVGVRKLEKIKAATAQNKKEIDGPPPGIRQRLLGHPAIAGAPRPSGTAAPAATPNILIRADAESTQKRLELIMDSLSADAPEPSSNPDETPDGPMKRYLQRRPFLKKPKDGDQRYSYHINFDNLESDRQFLIQTRKTLGEDTKGNAVDPALVADLDKLIACTHRLGMTEPERHAQITGVKQQSEAGERLAQMGKMAAFVVLAMMAAFTGLQAALTRKFSVTPLLFLGLAMLVANPELATSLFQPKELKVMNEAGRALNNDRFLYALCPTYGIEGRQWAEVVEQMMAKPGLTNRTMNAVQAAINRGAKPQEDPVVQKFFEDVGATDPKVRDKLLLMLGANVQELDERGIPRACPPDFNKLAVILGSVRDKEAQRLVVDYIRGTPPDHKGAWRNAARNRGKAGGMTLADVRPVSAPGTAPRPTAG